MVESCTLGAVPPRGSLAVLHPSQKSLPVLLIPSGDSLLCLMLPSCFLGSALLSEHLHEPPLLLQPVASEPPQFQRRIPAHKGASCWERVRSSDVQAGCGWNVSLEVTNVRRLFAEPVLSMAHPGKEAALPTPVVRPRRC